MLDEVQPLVDPAPADPRSEAELLAVLDRLVTSGRIDLELDRRKLTNMDFPLALEADGNRWLYPLLGIDAAAFWFGGFIIGAAVGVVAIGLYLTLGRADIARRLERRIRERALRSPDSWRKLWRFGGVILRSPNGIECQGPSGNWMALVRAEGAGAVRQ